MSQMTYINSLQGSDEQLEVKCISAGFISNHQLWLNHDLQIK